MGPGECEPRPGALLFRSTEKPRQKNPGPGEDSKGKEESVHPERDMFLGVVRMAP